MKKRVNFLNLMVLFCCVLLMGCGKLVPVQGVTEKVDVQDLLWEEVYIQEAEGYVPYIVLSDDYNGNSLLLRKYIMDEGMRMNEYYAYYEGCEMDRFLNKTFYENLPTQTKDIIVNTDVEVVAAGYSYAGHRIKKIERKVFLLSTTELGVDLPHTAGKEGRAIDYFEQPDVRIAYTKDEEISAWWLRSVDILYDSCFYGISGKGQAGSANAYDFYGVRPAFCVSGDTPISANSDLCEGKIVYVID